MILGQDQAVAAFTSAWTGRRLHHAWLLAGPRGVGKASFAREAAQRILAEAAGPPIDTPGLFVPQEHPTARLLAAGSHPDFRWVARVENPKKPGVLFKNILVDQIRGIGNWLNLTSSLSKWRVVVIDTADDLEVPGANALLKMLEEPPPHSLFFLVSHAPGRLLPTIRSRCRRLDFTALTDDAMASLLGRSYPDKAPAELKALVEFAGGSPGKAQAIAELDLAPLEADARAILREGDPDNGRRSKLASGLAGKAAAERYAAFIELIPGMIAREAVRLEGEELGRALDAYARARETVALAPRLSLDPAATVFQLGSILASVALKR